MNGWRKTWNADAAVWIREWRKRNKISQVTLAYKIGYSVNIVKMWEKGSIIPKPILRYALLGLEKQENQNENS